MNNQSTSDSEAQKLQELDSAVSLSTPVEETSSLPEIPVDDRDSHDNLVQVDADQITEMETQPSDKQP